MACALALAAACCFAAYIPRMGHKAQNTAAAVTETIGRTGAGRRAQQRMATHRRLFFLRLLLLRLLPLRFFLFRLFLLGRRRRRRRLLLGSAILGRALALRALGTAVLLLRASGGAFPIRPLGVAPSTARHTKSGSRTWAMEKVWQGPSAGGGLIDEPVDQRLLAAGLIQALLGA